MHIQCNHAETNEMQRPMTCRGHDDLGRPKSMTFRGRREAEAKMMQPEEVLSTISNTAATFKCLVEGCSHEYHSISSLNRHIQTKHKLLYREKFLKNEVRPQKKTRKSLLALGNPGQSAEANVANGISSSHAFINHTLLFLIPLVCCCCCCCCCCYVLLLLLLLLLLLFVD